MFTRPRRLTGMSRTTAIGWLQRGPGVRRSRVLSGLPAPRPLCRSTTRQTSGRETPNAEARGYRRALVIGMAPDPKSPNPDQTPTFSGRSGFWTGDILAVIRFVNPYTA
jgi:hypothetical protein